MKLKLTLLSAFILFCFAVKAQQIPNSGFETWTSQFYPDGFSDFETAFPIIPFNSLTFQDTVNKTQGKCSVKIITDSITFFPLGIIPGFIVFGNASLSTSGALTISAKPFSARPDTLFFDTRYSTPGADTAIFILLGKQGAVVALSDTLRLPTDTGWYSSFIVLTGSYNPAVMGKMDSLLLAFIVSGTQNPVKGSTLNIDNMHLGYVQVATGANNVKNQLNLNVYPNPASTILTITADKNLSGSSIDVFDVNGQLVSNNLLEGNTNTLNLSQLACGTYFYTIRDEKNMVIKTNKVSVVR